MFSFPGWFRSCVEAIKKKGANSITDDFMAEAERLAAEKRAVELEKTKLQIEINYRESVVADKQVIAEALKRFENVVKSLPPDEIQDVLQNPPAPLQISSFSVSERCLRHIVACGGRESQLRRWQELVRERQISVRK